jgi:tetratricopeptide (TPR) repeat protein
VQTDVQLKSPGSFVEQAGPDGRRTAMSNHWNKAAAMAALCLAVMPLQPVWSAGGGGGGGASMPSDSGPQYDPVAEYRKGVEAYQAKDFKAAATAFGRVVAVVPNHAPAQYLLGASHIGQGNFKKAKRPLEAAIKAEPAMLEAQRDLGITYGKLGDATKAAAQVEKLQALKTSCAGTCPQSAQIDAALEAVNAAMAGAPPQALGPGRTLAPLASIDASYVAAVGLINEGKFEPAIGLLQDALWAAGPHPDLLTYLGFANRKLGRYDQAGGWYQQALAIAPKHRGALEYYGELKLERGDRAGALAHLARLERICGFGCQEADELRSWINGERPSAS